MDKLNEIVKLVDDFVWGPVMLVLLVGTGIFLTENWISSLEKSSLCDQKHVEQGSQKKRKRRGGCFAVFGVDYRFGGNHRNR